MVENLRFANLFDGNAKLSHQFAFVGRAIEFVVNFFGNATEEEI